MSFVCLFGFLCCVVIQNPPAEQVSPDSREAQRRGFLRKLVDAAMSPEAALKILRVDLASGGYKITLPRQSAVFLKEALDGIRNEEAIAEAFRKQIKADADSKETARLLLMAHLVSKKLPEFRKELGEKMGKDGVEIRVWGVEQKRDGKIGMLLGVGKSLLPAVVNDKLAKWEVLFNTMPVYWKITPLSVD